MAKNLDLTDAPVHILAAAYEVIPKRTLSIPLTKPFRAPADGALVQKTHVQVDTLKSQVSALNAQVPTLAMVPTQTLKTGSSTGNYSSTSASYVAVDATNLAYKVVVPIGWKMTVWASGSISNAGAAIGTYVAITNNGTVLRERVVVQATANNWTSFALFAVINGDGLWHTVDLRYKTANAADAAQIANSGMDVPTMSFLLSQSV